MIDHGDLTINHGGKTYRIALRRNPRATRFTLRIRAATREAVLTAPAKSPLADVRKFASEHAEWIHSKLTLVPEAVPFQHGSIVPVRGIDHQIVHLRTERGLVSLERPNAESSPQRPLFLYVFGREEHVERRTSDFLKTLAKADIRLAVKKYCDMMKIQPPPVTVRDTVSRWGSCSSTGSLNFSWRLIFAPAFILDYLAAHEVAHIREMNHSKRFWGIVEMLCPETRSAEKWLDEHGTDLHRYGTRRKI